MTAQNSHNPGPGTYESHLKNRPQTPSYGIGSAKREYDPIQKEKVNVPGPNNYNPKVYDRHNAPQWLLIIYIALEQVRDRT